MLSESIGASEPIGLKLIGLSRIHFQYENQPMLLNEFTLHLRKGEVLSLIGPSGCGKSTILKIIAQHLKPHRGELNIPFKALTVFQKDALLPWLTVSENLEFAKRYALSTATCDEKGLLELFSLTSSQHKYPRELSGGLRQKAEVARAIVAGADMVLLDEAFSALDSLTRIHTRTETLKTLKSRGTTVLHVTHDIFEAAQLADRVIVLNGQPLQIEHDINLEGQSPRELTSPEFQKNMSLLASLMQIKN